jgi:hypothetical protein
MMQIAIFLPIPMVFLAGLLEIVDCYDKPFFPANRSKFLKSWVRQPNCHALGIQHGGKFLGYGVIRPCRIGYKIDPLFADSADAAEVLFLALRSRVKPSDSVFLDVPEVNGAAVMLGVVSEERRRLLPLK